MNVEVHDMLRQVIIRGSDVSFSRLVALQELVEKVCGIDAFIDTELAKETNSTIAISSRSNRFSRVK